MRFDPEVGSMAFSQLSAADGLFGTVKGDRRDEVREKPAAVQAARRVSFTDRSKSLPNPSIRRRR